MLMWFCSEDGEEAEELGDDLHHGDQLALTQISIPTPPFDFSLELPNCFVLALAHA